MTHSNKIYLSKSGKIFGPFSMEQLQSLKKQGEFEKFVWVCYDLKEGWEPIEPPPPLPQEGDGEVGGGIVYPGLKPKFLPLGALSEASSLGENFLALCHNHRFVLSGKIKDINHEGCTLTQSQSESSSIPTFLSGTKVILNLLDPGGSRSENINAITSHAIKNGGDWDYRLKWDHIPEILKSSSTRSG